MNKTYDIWREQHSHYYFECRLNVLDLSEITSFIEDEDIVLDVEQMCAWRHTFQGWEKIQGWEDILVSHQFSLDIFS